MFLRHVWPNLMDFSTVDSWGKLFYTFLLLLYTLKMWASPMLIDSVILTLLYQIIYNPIRMQSLCMLCFHHHSRNSQIILRRRKVKVMGDQHVIRIAYIFFLKARFKIKAKHPYLSVVKLGSSVGWLLLSTPSFYHSAICSAGVPACFLLITSPVNGKSGENFPTLFIGLSKRKLVQEKGMDEF